MSAGLIWPTIEAMAPNIGVGAAYAEIARAVRAVNNDTFIVVECNCVRAEE